MSRAAFPTQPVVSVPELFRSAFNLREAIEAATPSGNQLDRITVAAMLLGLLIGEAEHDNDPCRSIIASGPIIAKAAQAMQILQGNRLDECQGRA